MNHLVVVNPLPDEIDWGYLGRLMRVNDLRSTQIASRTIERHLSIARGHTMHALLSRLVGLSTEEFAQRHTTLPLRRAIAVGHVDVQHGSLERPGLLSWRAVKHSPLGIGFCPTCVAEEATPLEVSYWKRSHQTRGQIWCPKHQTSLLYVNERRIGSMVCHLPAELAESAQSLPARVVGEAQSNSNVIRYLSIAEAMYSRTVPVSASKVLSALQQLGEGRGLHLKTRTGQGVIDHRLMRSAYPKSWVEALFRDFGGKQPGGLLCERMSVSVPSILLVLAIIFEKVDDAMDFLSGLTAEELSPPGYKEGKMSSLCI